jgi:hypothetical protein
MNPPKVPAFFKEDIPMRFPQLIQRNPFLPMRSDELTLIPADRTAARNLVGRWELSSTGDADFSHKLGAPFRRPNRAASTPFRGMLARQLNHA